VQSQKIAPLSMIGPVPGTKSYRAAVGVMNFL
jgi:hypothetical protein